MKMTPNDKIATLKWLKEKKFVVVNGEIPPTIPENTKTKCGKKRQPMQSVPKSKKRATS